ncbi:MULTISPECIES: ABC transporter substrate-binding protein [Primorskyibacter]|uniref:Peptide/nickel transport system substrate-binding protein n=1 Tax=Primorskyibacter flagellatus TaxID=1387277 RepID=A0A1W2EL13_9RHOB|nr:MULTISPECIES: ABC transporter substrate-binding protein [Primorskyibacter]SMD10335.1 peptide/nickel transport system substrate-binding protein [Primorskyibacter flagellatus]
MPKLSYSTVFTASLLATTAMSDQCPTVASPSGIAHHGLDQVELSAFEAQTGDSLTFHDNPNLEKLVNRGPLPPVSERLPAEPLVILPYEDCGTYGGEMRYLARKLESNTSEGLSWRQVQLVRVDDDLRTIKPDVAKSWAWNHDYTEITFTLRKGHKWSDGTPFTAHDVAFWLNDLINNEELYPTTRAPWSVGSRAEVIDEVTVKFVFDVPQPNLLEHLVTQGQFYAAFAPKHALIPFHGDFAEDADAKAQAAGHNTWADWFRLRWGHWMDRTTHSALGLEVPTLESHIMVTAPEETHRDFVPNPYYHHVDSAGQQLPYVDRHRERFIDPSLYVIEIINGNVDQKSLGPIESYSALKENEAGGIYKVILPEGNKGPYIAFNQTHQDPAVRAIYADVRFRQAMSMAIDRDEVSETLFLGLGTPGSALPHGTPTEKPGDQMHFSGFDPEAAGQLLDEMGMKMGPDGFRLRPDGEPFSIIWEYSTQFTGAPDFPTLVAEMWRSVGIDTQLREISSVDLGDKGRANALDITMIYDQPTYPVLAGGVDTLVPPFHINDPLMGVPWMDWINTNGSQGEEPPAWINDLVALGPEMAREAPGSEAWNAALDKITDIHREQMPIIGIFSSLPRVSVINKDLKNVPEITTIGNTSYTGYLQPWRVDQWYYPAD